MHYLENMRVEALALFGFRFLCSSNLGEKFSKNSRKVDRSYLRKLGREFLFLLIKEGPSYG